MMAAMPCPYQVGVDNYELESFAYQGVHPRCKWF